MAHDQPLISKSNLSDSRISSLYLKNILFNSVQSYLGGPLADYEKPKVITLYNSIDPQLFKGHSLTECMSVLGKIIAERIQRQRKKLAQQHQSEYISQQKLGILQSPDIKDILKDMIGSSSESNADQYVSSFIESDDQSTTNQSISEQQTIKDIEINSFLGIDNLSTLQLLFNPEALYVHYYVVLDTDYRLTDEESGSTISQFKWNYSSTQNLETGFCNSVGRIRDVIGIRMYQPRVYYLSEMDTTAKRVSVLIEEFKHQAFIGENGRRFHFLFRPNLSPISQSPPETQIELTTEDYNDGIYSFRKPITTFDTLTISFGDPLTILNFPTSFERMQFAFEFVCYKSDK